MPVLPAARTMPVAGAASRRRAVLGTVAALVATAATMTAATAATASPERAPAEAAVIATADVRPVTHGEQARLAAQYEAAQARAAAAAAKERARAKAEAKAERERTARAAARERAARSAVRDPKGAARTLMADKYGWGGDQFRCLESLWQRESNWSYRARNRSSGAYGIPQALPGAKMASAGSDWRTNPRTQILWGLGYIKGVYGTPCSALGHSNSVGWY